MFDEWEYMEDCFKGDQCSKSEHHEWKVLEKNNNGFLLKIKCIHCDEIHICKEQMQVVDMPKISYKMPSIILSKTNVTK